MDSKLETIFINDIEITVWDMTLIMLNMIFFATVIMLFMYFNSTDDREEDDIFLLEPYCNLGEGHTSKFFTIKGGKETIQRRKQGGKSSIATKEKYGSVSQIEVKCNYCKTTFSLQSKRK